MSAYHELQKGKLYQLYASESNVIYNIFEGSDFLRKIGEAQSFSIVVFLEWKLTEDRYYYGSKQDLWLRVLTQDMVGWIRALERTDTLVELEET